MTIEGKDNAVLIALQDRRMAVGVGVQIATPEAVEMVGYAGYDFAFIDGEHGAFGADTLFNMIRAADASGTCPVVRVPSHDRAHIGRMLDAGALGIIVPDVRTATQAEAICAAMRFPDAAGYGDRGACPGTRATRHQVRDWPAYVAWAHANTMVWLIIEHPDAIANIEAIAAVPNIGALMLGPYDLAQAMGYPGQPHHPEVVSALSKVVDAARRNGINVVGSLFKRTAAEMAIETADWISRGVRIFVAGSDKRMLYGALAERLAGILQRPD